MLKKWCTGHQKNLSEKTANLVRFFISVQFWLALCKVTIYARDSFFSMAAESSV